MNKRIFFHGLGLSLFFFSLSVFGKPSIEDTTKYQSQFDQSLTFKRMTFLPSVDNVNNVYGKAIDEKLKNIISANHQWDLVETDIVGSVVRPEELVGNPKKVKTLSKHLGADGFFIGELRKDPKETTIHLYLFSSRSGDLVTEEVTKTPSDNTSIVKAHVEEMVKRIKKKIPYDALILSRTDNRVTLNAGRSDGARVGQNLTAIKVIGAKKHPKRKFIIQSSKVVIGQIRIVKVDKSLSFADIVTETEPGVISEGTKLTGISKIKYKQTPWTKTYTPPEQLLTENNKSVFGKEAMEWVAKDPPTFGKVGANFAIGNFNNNLGLANGTSLDAKVSAYPKIDIRGEMWVTPKFYANAMFAQGIGQSNNPSGSPSEISNSLTQYRLSFGYNFLLKNDFFGPKINFDLGLASYRMFVDASSTASGFTSMTYRSLPLGIGGFTPITKTGNWGVGGKAYFHLFPSLSESPFSSGGDSDNSINQFELYAENKFSQRLRLKFGVEFLLLSTNFSGFGGRTIPANSSSHRLTMLTTGIDYLF